MPVNAMQFLQKSQGHMRYFCPICELGGIVARLKEKINFPVFGETEHSLVHVFRPKGRHKEKAWEGEKDNYLAQNHNYK